MGRTHDKYDDQVDATGRTEKKVKVIGQVEKVDRPVKGIEREKKR